jgi:hypothetical protein
LYLLEVVEDEYGYPGFGRFAHICGCISRRQISSAVGFDHITSVHGIFLEIALHITDFVLNDEVYGWLGLGVER